MEMRRRARVRSARVTTGLERDPAVREAIETHAQALAEEHFTAKRWLVEDVHTTKPFDFIARKGDDVRYVEVKGTLGSGATVELTVGEVRFARRHPGEPCRSSCRV